MKPGRFDYMAPATLDEALAGLAEHGDTAKVLAGGQSLVPAMNFRLAQPEVLLDINRIEGLDAVDVDGDSMAIGALVRHEDLATVAVEDPLARLLGRVAGFVGHYPIRVRGTFAGSLAHADPAAEWCMLALALDAVVVTRNVHGSRKIPARDFFDSPFMTALSPDELITEVRLPLLGRGTGAGFMEHSHTAGDFATVAAMATVRVTDDRITQARVAVAGVEGRPLRGDAAEDELTGAPARPEVAQRAAAAFAGALDPTHDLHASSEYRRHLTRVLTERAIVQALGEAA